MSAFGLRENGEFGLHQNLRWFCEHQADSMLLHLDRVTLAVPCSVLYEVGRHLGKPGLQFGSLPRLNSLTFLSKLSPILETH